MKLELLTNNDITYNYSGKQGKTLKVFEKYGILAYPNDFTLSRGIHINNLCVPYWINSNIKLNYVNAVNSSNGYGNFIRTDSCVGIRPKVRYSEIASFVLEISSSNELFEAKAFEYIGNVVDQDLNDELDASLLNGSLIKTGKTYTVDASYDAIEDKINYSKAEEYYYNGNKYVLLKLNRTCVLSNLIINRAGEDHWFRIEPIDLIVSLDDDIAVFKKIVASGFPFSFKPCKSIDESFIQTFLDDILAEELIPSNVKTNEKTMQEKPKELSKKLSFK